MGTSEQSGRSGFALITGSFAVIAAFLVVTIAVQVVPARATPSVQAELRVVSSRADMVSGDDALVRLSFGEAAVSSVRLSLNGVRTDTQFRRDSERSILAYVTGLQDGTNLLKVEQDGAVVASATLINHAISGPIISGPHQTPWLCDTHDFALPDGTHLPPANNRDCTVSTVVQYVYQNFDGDLVPLANPSDVPPDVRTTTTVNGMTVNFIVRVETGTINRGIYQISMLHDPSTDAPPSPWDRSRGWNGRLVYFFGGGCNPGYRQSTSFGYPELPLHEIGGGYAVAASTLNVWGNNCNSLLSAETLSMTKERFIETYGAPRYTIGRGSSGGAKSQLMIADAYPGLLDGILPADEAGGPDGVTANPSTVDCSLLAEYFNKKTSLSWTYEQKSAVAGWAGWNNCERQGADNPPVAGASYWHERYSPYYVVPTSHRPAQFSGCPAEIESSRIYDAETNPNGIRCDVYSTLSNIFGRSSSTTSAPRRPLDSVGIEYGLEAVNAGVITAEQFVELNEKIGGYDADGGFIEGRSVADPIALKIAYQTGQVVSGGRGLNSTPIIDLRRYLDTLPNIHDRLGTFITKRRLQAVNGDSANMVLYTYPNTRIATEVVTNEALSRMTEWLDAVHMDTSADSLAVKVRRSRPGDLADTCWDENLRRIVEPAVYGEASRCNELFPSFANPRIAAGMPVEHNVLKCQLKQISPAEYGGLLNEVQIARLRAVHPDGVCDFSKPGVEQQPLAGTWFSFQTPGMPTALDR